MSRELISKATRDQFREVIKDFFCLREIDMIFQAGGLAPRANFKPQVNGERRGRVETYYANIDFSSPGDVRKLLVAYEELIERLRSAQGSGMNAQDVKTKIGVLLHRMERDGFHYENGRFVSETLNLAIVQAPTLVQLTEASITEHVDKARRKIEAGDNAGAIASSYTLVEEFLKELLRRTGTPFKENEGDIRELYKLASDPLNLNPAGETLESYLKAILQGLRQQICGLYELANKASDRHARRYNPACHHAKLAVNAAFTLCEFLLDSYEYQKQRQERQPVS
ncbi:MAG: abortive infection family protein [Bryobacteraceae bacterium]|nr:abortive infection family protein [Bryobacteraceae bacterium]